MPSGVWSNRTTSGPHLLSLRDTPYTHTHNILSKQPPGLRLPFSPRTPPEGKAKTATNMAACRRAL